MVLGTDEQIDEYNIKIRNELMQIWQLSLHLSILLVSE